MNIIDAGVMHSKGHESELFGGIFDCEHLAHAMDRRTGGVGDASCRHAKAPVSPQMIAREVTQQQTEQEV